ncbi:DDE-type integrase/transposase/recombinase [Vibrio parahaemolyticus]|nr:DDE-type integrase/transposase/recombinase [Vibrio parahaemolyticus]EIA1769787.1 DDE-type integrase/transposase/recombinase [Vibrio parahaemolyticus]EJG1086816.1 DDE-type integrase/transposase/recombinase [Vibrio parahaemolyticus]EJS4017146.1 DDE-type integrase/transposase/recombinase [Vibrio parahaemolyticus]
MPLHLKLSVGYVGVGKPSWASSWQLDETYIKVKGRWMYLYRAITNTGDTVEFYLSSTRNAKAAQRFLNKALREC